MPSFRRFLPVVFALAACNRSATATTTPGQAVPGVRAPTSPEVCAAWGPPVESGRISTEHLDELSGAAVSRKFPGVLWVHNDSGHKPRLWAIDGKGNTLGTFKLKHQPDRDWEDIAVGACSTDKVLAGASCVYLADTGDNSGSRSQYTILRWPEPQQLPAQPADAIKVADDAVETFAFTYPDGPVNVEAMAVLPDTRVVLLSKRDDGQSQVFRLTLQGGGKAEALGVLDVRSSRFRRGDPVKVTAADLTRDGRWLLVRTYGSVLLYDAGPLLSGPPDKAAEGLGKLKPVEVPAAIEPHGEAIAWDPAGGFWQVSEGQGASIWHVPCATPHP